ncbi:uncharacterized protein LOC122794035 isoform X2 [Protopterus annectens]|uniref:uncharacterized protein LOC122794035 isoform X2 n=1 Tax=Protopterus annectens TaxID=7888 RepID=UPI001CFBB50D|nr:uncharacterized protein LOC122794035 isoform X2 [Protopterus annectens]
MGCNCCKMVKSYMIDPNGSVNIISRGHSSNANNNVDDFNKSGISKDSLFVINSHVNHDDKAFDNIALEDDVSSPESHVINCKQHTFPVQKEPYTSEYNGKGNTIISSVCISTSDDTLHSISSLEKDKSEADLSDAAIQLTDSVDSVVSDTQMEVVSQQQDMGYDSETDDASLNEKASHGQDTVQKLNDVVANHLSCEERMKSPPYSTSFPQNQPQYVHLSLTDLGNANLLSQTDTYGSMHQTKTHSSFGEINSGIAEGNATQEESNCRLALAHDGQINTNIVSSQIRHGTAGEPTAISEEDPDVLEALAALEAATADEDDD